MTDPEKSGRRRRPPKRPKTPREMFRDLPAFVPNPNPEIVYVGPNGSDRWFDDARSCEIEERLSIVVSPHIRAVTFDGRPASLARLLHETQRAMARFEHERRQTADLDHKAGRKLLEKTADALDGAERALRMLNERPAVVGFLRDLVDGFDDRSVPPDRPFSMIAANVRRQRDDASWQAMSPDAIIAVVMRLSAALRFAEERITPDGGEARRDQPAADFLDGLAYAWRCGTGRLPTWGVDRERERGPSPFRAYVETVNTLLPADWQSENDFETYALATIRALKRRTGPALG